MRRQTLQVPGFWEAAYYRLHLTHIRTTAAYRACRREQHISRRTTGKNAGISVTARG